MIEQRCLIHAMGQKSPWILLEISEAAMVCAGGTTVRALEVPQQRETP
jgi:hypothetical protein